MNTLVREYDAGRLVPFLGAGMSRRVCPDWQGFISNLESEAGLKNGQVDDNSADALTRRGMRAVRLLRRREPERFAEAIGRALAHDHNERCPQTEALAQIWWPLVLTTNYDDLYLTHAFNRWDSDAHSVAVSGAARPFDAGARPVERRLSGGRPVPLGAVAPDPVGDARLHSWATREG